MDEFARTGNGKRFLENVRSISKSLESIASFCAWQEKQAQEDLWAVLYAEDQVMYRALKAIQRGELVHGAADMWNDRLEDFLRQLQIDYYRWLYHRARDNKGAFEVFGTGFMVFSGHPVAQGDFEGPPEQQLAAMEAAASTEMKVSW